MTPPSPYDGDTSPASLGRNDDSLRIEHDHRAQDLAGFHVAKTLVDLRKFYAGRDPVVEVQAALQVVLHQPRHVDAEAVGAHRRALHLLLAAQELEAVQLDLG